jgi:hypothetical protein
LERRPSRRQYRRKLDGDGEAHLVALACQEPPEGRSRWTLQLLAERIVGLASLDGLKRSVGMARWRKPFLSRSTPGRFTAA